MQNCRQQKVFNKLCTKSVLCIFWNKARKPRQTMGSSSYLQDMCRTLEIMTSGTRQSMGFGIPMFLREPTNHIDGCYFCSINVTGINKKEAQIFELQKLSYRSLSYRSLKCVLLHITNVYGSIPIGHSTTLQEKYDAIKSVLQHIKYKNHQG